MSSQKAKCAPMIWVGKRQRSTWPKPSPTTRTHNQRFFSTGVDRNEHHLHGNRPRRFAPHSETVRREIVAKISRLEHGLRGDIKRLTNFDCDYRLRCGDYRVLFDVEDDEVLVHRILH